MSLSKFYCVILIAKYAQEIQKTHVPSAITMTREQALVGPLVALLAAQQDMDSIHLHLMCVLFVAQTAEIAHSSVRTVHNVIATFIYTMTI